MLVIRPEQMKAFADAGHRQFAADACHHCRLRHPDICISWDDGELHAIVDNGLRRARSYGFETAADLIRFLDLAMTQGVDFDESDWAAPILSLRQYLPKARLDLLFRTVAARAEESAAPAPPPPAIRDVSWPQPEPQPVPPAPVQPPLDANSTPPPPAKKWGMTDHAMMSAG